MNVVIWLLVLFLFGAIGGAVQGFMTYDGFIVPEVVRREVLTADGHKTPVTMLAPGFIGQMLVGGVAGVLVFCIYSKPGVSLSWDADMNITLYQFSTVLLAGLAGSIAINELVEKKQWQKLAPVLKQTNPTTVPNASLDTMRPVEALQFVGTPT